MALIITDLGCFSTVTENPRLCATQLLSGSKTNIHLLIYREVYLSIPYFCHINPGGGPASDSESLGIPCHVIDFEGVRPMLEFLMACYGVSLVGRHLTLSM